MNIAILLCSVILTADSPAPVEARVLYGTASEGNQRNDIEPWISQAAAKFGSPRVVPHTAWVALTGDHRSLDRSTKGGLLIDGKAAQQNGKYAVEITACAGISLGGEFILNPGERRIIKLTDNAAPDNVFVALKAPVSRKANERAEAMKANAGTFRLDLNYNGEQGKPFYKMIVSVPAISRRRRSPFERIIQVQQSEAIRIIDHLARDGFFDQNVKLRTNARIPAPAMPGYTMKVGSGDKQWYRDLGWGLPMIHRLDALGAVLPDHGRKDMALLLGRLSGLRTKWEVEHPPFVASVGQDASQVRFATDGDTTVIDITSKLGIGEATIKRESPQWPVSMAVRLHLKGLELLNVSNGEISVDWSVSSTGDHPSTVFLRNGGKETALNTKSPYHTRVRIVGGKGQIPLGDGYFEVRLPSKLFERNPEEIRLEWIDFYRN